MKKSDIVKHTNETLIVLLMHKAAKSTYTKRDVQITEWVCAELIKRKVITSTDEIKTYMES